MTVVIDSNRLKEIRELYQRYKNEGVFDPFAKAMSVAMSVFHEVEFPEWFEYARELLELEGISRKEVAAKIVLTLYHEGFSPVGFPGQHELHRFLEYCAKVARGVVV